MKRIAILFAFLFIVALTLSSCGKEVCPAYSQADTEIEHIG